MEEKTKKKSTIWFPAFICILIMTLICGLVYPLVMTAAAQLMPNQANGSLITVNENGKEVCYGSKLIGQKFTQPQYLIGRPDSGAPTNLSPVSPEQAALVAERVEWWHKLDPQNTADIPAELVSASGSGVDPHISPAAAQYQVARIARERGMSEDAVRTVIDKYTEGKTMGVLGEARVNVLMVNLELDGKIGKDENL
ncbi:MAG: K(+)-transporting ATPase subunit C [Christensenella sp.]